MWNVFISMNFRRYDTFLFFFRKHDMVDVYILCFQKWNNNMISTCTIRSSFCSCEIKEHFFTCTLYRCSRCHKIRLQGWNCYKYFLTHFTDNMQVSDCNIIKFCRLIGCSPYLEKTKIANIFTYKEFWLLSKSEVPLTAFTTKNPVVAQK